MRTLLNILWHIPFLGFVFSLLYLLAGAIWCITIIGIPIGRGMFQISKFMLSPFTCELIPHRDLAMAGMVKGRGIGGKTFNTIARILYFIPGLVHAAISIAMIAVEFVSIIGIPCALVYAKALPAIFNPIDKVCVRREILPGR